MTMPRYPLSIRCLASVAILAVAAAGAGVPMCVSLLARAATPCAMHTDPGAPGHDHDVGISITAAPVGHDTCHDDAQTVGCAAGGVCPSGVTGALSSMQIDGVASPSHAFVFASTDGHESFIAAPLPPPPLA